MRQWKRLAVVGAAACVLIVVAQRLASKQGATTLEPTPEAIPVATFTSIDFRSEPGSGGVESAAESKRVATTAFAESRPAMEDLRTEAPGLSIRGRITSPWVKRDGADGEDEFGVNETCIVKLFWCRQEPRGGTNYIEVKSARPDHGGFFEIPLKRGGVFRIGADHVPRHADLPYLREHWYTLVDVKDEALDLGAHRFSGLITRGVVKDEFGEPVETTVNFDDRVPRPVESSLTLPGTEFGCPTDEAGRFAFSAAKAPYRVVGLLEPFSSIERHYRDGALYVMGVATEGVVLGSFYEFVVRSSESPELFELVLTARVPIRSTVHVIGQGRATTTVVRTEGRDEKFQLKRGRYVVEVSSGDRFHSQVLDVQDHCKILVDSVSDGARVVEGSCAAGASVARVVGPYGLQSTVGDETGRFRLDGLPPRGELQVRIGDRVVTVPDDSGLYYRVP